jgi:hypothetical protein
VDVLNCLIDCFTPELNFRNEFSGNRAVESVADRSPDSGIRRSTSSQATAAAAASAALLPMQIPECLACKQDGGKVGFERRTLFVFILLVFCVRR